MFWYSLSSALKVMTYAETYLVILEYLFLLLIPILLIFINIRNRQGKIIKYFRVLLLPVLEAIAVAVFVLTLYPIILGIGENASWSFPLRIIQLTPGGFLGYLGILTLLAIVLTAIPKLSYNWPFFKTLILGSVSLIFVRVFLSFINPIIDVGIMDLVPGFWFLLGIIAMSGLLSKIGYYLRMYFSTFLINRYQVKDGLAELLILPVTATLGLIPVLVYGAWLA